MQDYTIFLRAVASHITGADLLYTAAASLDKRPRLSAAARSYNLAVCVMTARLLNLPDTDPEAVQRALLDLPPRE